ncbi:FeoB-associated Cys-rich membrane protein [Dokdonia sp. Hel_I_53]|nr:FeoB-associated Cys-rich membrane protein [Dokdonia sp. Hel_I_53]TVZ52868.1 hypothetical protein OD90_2054 [Dokdonia sp. Hel_I_53]
MELLQNILVILIFIMALGYIVTKFIWTPSFLKKKNETGCGSSGCGCS